MTHKFDLFKIAVIFALATMGIIAVIHNQNTLSDGATFCFAVLIMAILFLGCVIDISRQTAASNACVARHHDSAQKKLVRKIHWECQIPTDCDIAKKLYLALTWSTSGIIDIDSLARTINGNIEYDDKTDFHQCVKECCRLLNVADANNNKAFRLLKNKLGPFTQDDPKSGFKNLREYCYACAEAIKQSPALTEAKDA